MDERSLRKFQMELRVLSSFHGRWPNTLGKEGGGSKLKIEGVDDENDGEVNCL